MLLLVLVALALAAAQVILAMKMKEGREWARFALTIVAGVSLLLAIINASAADGRGGGSWPGFIISLVATVLMWLPNSQAWFASCGAASEPPLNSVPAPSRRPPVCSQTRPAAAVRTRGENTSPE